jgi:hypothetical protein
MGLLLKNFAESNDKEYISIERRGDNLAVEAAATNNLYVRLDLYMGLLKHHFLKYLILEQYDQQKRKMLCKLQLLKFTEHLSLLLIILLKN